MFFFHPQIPANTDVASPDEEDDISELELRLAALASTGRASKASFEETESQGACSPSSQPRKKSPEANRRKRVTDRQQSAGASRGNKNMSLYSDYMSALQPAKI